MLKISRRVRRRNFTVTGKYGTGGTPTYFIQMNDIDMGNSSQMVVMKDRRAAEAVARALNDVYHQGVDDTLELYRVLNSGFERELDKD